MDLISIYLIFKMQFPCSTIQNTKKIRKDLLSSIVGHITKLNPWLTELLFFISAWNSGFTSQQYERLNLSGTWLKVKNQQNVKEDFGFHFT